MPTRNASNTGKGFEAALEGMFTLYETKGLARIKKVDPPTAFAGRRLVNKRNPWLDYSGCWRGASIHIEAKSRTPAATKTPDEHWIRLRAKSGGMTERQVDELIAWGKSGAIVVVVWELMGVGTRLFDWSIIHDSDKMGINRMYWAEGVDVEATAMGPDVLRTIERAHGGLM